MLVKLGDVWVNPESVEGIGRVDSVSETIYIIMRGIIQHFIIDAGKEDMQGVIDKLAAIVNEALGHQSYGNSEVEIVSLEDKPAGFTDV